MPDNPEFTAADVEAYARRCVSLAQMDIHDRDMSGSEYHDLANMLRMLATRLRAEHALKPAPDAGTGPPSCDENCTRCSGEWCNSHFGSPCGCDVVQRHAVDAGTGEARPDNDEAVRPFKPQPHAPVPDLAELLTDEWWVEVAWAAGTEVTRHAEYEHIKTTVMSTVSDWLVSREEASRRRMEELTGQLAQWKERAGERQIALDAAEAALAQLRREAPRGE